MAIENKTVTVGGVDYELKHIPYRLVLMQREKNRMDTDNAQVTAWTDWLLKKSVVKPAHISELGLDALDDLPYEVIDELIKEINSFQRTGNGKGTE